MTILSMFKNHQQNWYILIEKPKKLFTDFSKEKDESHRDSCSSQRSGRK